MWIKARKPERVHGKWAGLEKVLEQSGSGDTGDKKGIEEERGVG